MSLMTQSYKSNNSKMSAQTCTPGLTSADFEPVSQFSLDSILPASFHPNLYLHLLSATDVPPRIAAAMNTDPSAASTLNYHIDRKMTVINGDLHRLQDSLTAHLPTSTFATTLLTLLPSIENLASLPGGASLAFELVIKLGGNLNSHGGDDGWNNDADIQSRASFYSRLDDCMVDVIRQRLSQAGGEDPPWVVGRDVKRLEKTGSFLRSKIGLQSYFPRSLDVMRYEAKRGDSQQI